ncbi:hypothetical protein MoryE10_34020 [Methylogaea oryzae]|uniref:Uncharacterized protein n=2 Tax=Methylogaea oryzae TaxID=1295382 RepID=A0A8D5AM46_9GAMM|nr:hypothetical protein MoryE10_34020 [Methylogaea oryzae]
MKSPGRFYAGLAFIFLTLGIISPAFADSYPAVVHTYYQGYTSSKYDTYEGAGTDLCAHYSWTLGSIGTKSSSNFQIFCKDSNNATHGAYTGYGPYTEKLCPGGGTVSGTSCINAPACAIYQDRGSDGVCHDRTCGANQHLDYTTGGCVYDACPNTWESRNTLTGECVPDTCEISGQIRNVTTGVCEWPPNCEGDQFHDVDGTCKDPECLGDLVLINHYCVPKVTCTSTQVYDPVNNGCVDVTQNPDPGTGTGWDCTTASNGVEVCGCNGTVGADGTCNGQPLPPGATTGDGSGTGTGTGTGDGSGTGTGTGTGDGSGTGTGTGTGDGTGTGTGTGDGTGTGSGSDPQDGGTGGTGFSPGTYGSPPGIEGVEAQVAAAKSELSLLISNIKSESQAMIGSTSLGGGGSLPCFSASTSYGDVRLCLSDYEDKLVLIRYALLLVASVAAALIILG